MISIATRILYDLFSNKLYGLRYCFHSMRFPVRDNWVLNIDYRRAKYVAFAIPRYNGWAILAERLKILS
jgi:hypothetical protein